MARRPVKANSHTLGTEMQEVRCIEHEESRFLNWISGDHWSIFAAGRCGTLICTLFMEVE
jgi:hypothetical protein